MWRLILVAILVLGIPVDGLAQPVSKDNAEMTDIFEADQKIREELTPDKVSDQAFLRRIFEGDMARRHRTEELLADGALSTGNDYYHAAFIFQHGSDPDSYLLAHSLALAATAKGHARAPWIAAATLDRYLQEIGRPQIYGTQFTRSADQGWTLAPYDRELVPDALRTALGVPDQEAQEARLAEKRGR